MQFVIKNCQIAAIAGTINQENRPQITKTGMFDAWDGYPVQIVCSRRGVYCSRASAFLGGTVICFCVRVDGTLAIGGGAGTGLETATDDLTAGALETRGFSAGQSELSAVTSVARFHGPFV